MEKDLKLNYSMNGHYEIKSLNNFINEFRNNSLWRNTNHRWLLELLKNGKVTAEKGRFISFSSEEDSGGQDDFGGTRIKFNENIVYKQGAIEINYDTRFFEEYPEISRYVCGFKSEEEYYSDKGYSGAEEANADMELTWDQYVEGFENENEVVIKKIKFTENLIESVNFIKDKPNKKLIELLNMHNIEYTQ